MINVSLTKRIGERIRSLRKARGLSQEELAEKAAVHYTFIGQVERGEKNFSIDTLERVIIGLDTSFEEIFRGLSINNIEESKLELLINRIQEKKPPEREDILNTFHNLLDWKEN